MSRIYPNVIKVLSLCLLVMAFGCNDPNAGMEEDLQAGAQDRLLLESNLYLFW